MSSHTRLSDGTRLHLSIAGSVVSYYVVQGAVWIAVVLGYGVRPTLIGTFFPVSLGFHLVIYGFLVWKRGDFVLTDTGRPLRRVNLACHLTLFRVSATPTLLFLLLLTTDYRIAGVLVPFAAVAFLTDLLDGQAARRLRQTTIIGRYLDSTCDYVVLIVTGTAFLILGVIPLWFFVGLMVRLLAFAAGMGAIILIQGSVEAESTFLGKVAVFSTMATFGFQLCRYLGVPSLGNPTLVLGVEIACAAALAASVVDKALYLTRKFNEIRLRRRAVT